uniref:Uncharacterized protein n=1 Tax=Glossina palpalis gambiensis TaxID=67801 RepID=A0A1B0BX99_9MUSC
MVNKRWILKASWLCVPEDQVIKKVCILCVRLIKRKFLFASESHIMIKVPNKQHNCDKIFPMRVSMSAKPTNQTTNQSTSYSTITDSSISVVHLIRRQNTP